MRSPCVHHVCPAIFLPQVTCRHSLKRDTTLNLIPRCELYLEQDFPSLLRIQLPVSVRPGVKVSTDFYEPSFLELCKVQWDWRLPVRAPLPYQWKPLHFRRDSVEKCLLSRYVMAFFYVLTVTIQECITLLSFFSGEKNPQSDVCFGFVLFFVFF